MVSEKIAKLINEQIATNNTLLNIIFQCLHGFLEKTGWNCQLFQSTEQRRIDACR